MSQRAQNISKRIKSFADEVITFVEGLTENDWTKICDWENWSVGVTARQTLTRILHRLNFRCTFQKTFMIYESINACEKAILLR